MRAAAARHVLASNGLPHAKPECHGVAIAGNRSRWVYTEAALLVKQPSDKEVPWPRPLAGTHISGSRQAVRLQ